MREIWFIINPKSGTKLKNGIEGLKNEILQISKQFSNTNTEIKSTTHAGHAFELALEAVKAKVAIVVAVGGDGTANEVGRGVVHSQTAMAIVPLGSGNGLARHLGIPMNVSAAIRCVFEGKNHLIDSAKLNDIPFFCTAGLGFDAEVAGQFAKQKSRGLITYVKLSILTFFRFVAQFYTIDGVEKQLFTLTFANASQYGNNAYIAPNAIIDDGLLDVCQWRPNPFYRSLEMVWRLFTKRLNQSKYVSIVQTKSLKVQTAQPSLIHYDGESLQLNTNTFEVEIVPKSLWIVC